MPCSGRASGGFAPYPIAYRALTPRRPELLAGIESRGFVLGVLNNGLDHVNIDSFLKILIRGLILLAALIINVYAQRLREQAAD